MKKQDLESDIENVFVERLRKLKASRSAKLGALTIKRNEIRIDGKCMQCCEIQNGK